jgi:hypothetical protein
MEMEMETLLVIVLQLKLSRVAEIPISVQCTLSIIRWPWCSYIETLSLVLIIDDFDMWS